MRIDIFRSVEGVLAGGCVGKESNVSKFWLSRYGSWVVWGLLVMSVVLEDDFEPSTITPSFASLVDTALRFGFISSGSLVSIDDGTS